MIYSGVYVLYVSSPQNLTLGSKYKSTPIIHSPTERLLFCSFILASEAPTSMEVHTDSPTTVALTEETTTTAEETTTTETTTAEETTTTAEETTTTEAPMDDPTTESTTDITTSTTPSPTTTEEDDTTSEADHHSTTMCESPGDSDCMTTAQTTLSALPDPSDPNTVLIAVIAGGIGTAMLVIIVILIVVIISQRFCRQRRIVHARKNSQQLQNNGVQGTLGNRVSDTMRSVNNYDYIESTTLPRFNQYPHTADNVAYNVHAHATIMAESNQAYGVAGVTGVTGVTGITDLTLENEDVIYEAIDEVENGGKKNNEIKTEANHAYGMNSDGVVLSPNHAYGVSTKSFYYI